MHEFSSPLLFAFDSVAPNTPEKWVDNDVHKEKWIFAVTLLGIPISQIRTSLSGTRHYETAQCPLKKHRQKPKVLSVTPMACYPFPQTKISFAGAVCLIIDGINSRSKQRHSNVIPLSCGFNKNVPASCSNIPHLNSVEDLSYQPSAGRWTSHHSVLNQLWTASGRSFSGLCNMADCFFAISSTWSCMRGNKQGWATQHSQLVGEMIPNWG